ncbi:M48 family metallopeptidase [Nonomuraea sp. NPDC050310]|uniref:M48 metallopeptidase family protein n=1 Tax=unclassified Nonomuraea TaxID=2593643 RepID=UPI003411444A
MPASLSGEVADEWVSRMLERLEAKEKRRHPNDQELFDRAVELSTKYLGGKARPESVRWVDNQQHRWGSCTPENGTIRISTRIRGLPEWVINYVIIHELVHLLVPGHGPKFWKLVKQYPRAERARGFLEGFSVGTHNQPEEF